MKPTSPPRLRERLKDETRQIILDAFATLLANADVEKITFADVAAQAGVGERTVYRHFPTRDDLLRGLYASFGPTGDAMIEMTSEADLTAHLPGYFATFDAQSAVIKATVTTPQGYELRMANRSVRNQGFLRALDGATSGLSAQERAMAAAIVQHLHSASAWLALREGWDLRGDKAATAVAWAIRTLVKDLKRRRGKSLAAD